MQGTARPPGQDELQPEGNGTGFLWDDAGNVVTNYHVLQSALAALGRRPGAQRAGQGGQVVAKITLLGIEILPNEARKGSSDGCRAASFDVLASLCLLPEATGMQPLAAGPGRFV